MFPVLSSENEQVTVVHKSIVNHPPDVVVLTALGLEFVAVRYWLDGVHDRLHDDGTVYCCGTLRGGSLTVAIVETGPGNVAATAEAMRALQHFKSKTLLFVGIAGGIKDVAIGDVVAASKIYAYEGGKSLEDTFLPRSNVIQPSYALVQAARAIARDENWHAKIMGGDNKTATVRVIVGPIAAGEKVIAAEKSRVALFLGNSYSDAVAVEMEGFGAALAASQIRNVEYIVIRGIADMLSGKGQAEETGSQPFAAAHAAAFAAALLLRLAPSEEIETEHASKAVELQDSLVDVLSRLYPEGPRQNDVWRRAGGDISKLDLSGNSRTAWYRATHLLLLGGGGALSLRSLLAACLDDYRENPALNELINNI